MVVGVVVGVSSVSCSDLTSSTGDDSQPSIHHFLSLLLAVDIHVVAVAADRHNRLFYRQRAFDLLWHFLKQLNDSINQFNKLTFVCLYLTISNRGDLCSVSPSNQPPVAETLTSHCRLGHSTFHLFFKFLCC